MQRADLDSDYVPKPIVMIDQDSDSDATLVQVSFGDRLGALIDTVRIYKKEIFYCIFLFFVCFGYHTLCPIEFREGAWCLKLILLIKVSF